MGKARYYWELMEARTPSLVGWRYVVLDRKLDEMVAHCPTEQFAGLVSASLNFHDRAPLKHRRRREPGFEVRHG